MRHRFVSRQAVAALSIAVYHSGLIGTRHARLRQGMLACFRPHQCYPRIRGNWKAWNVEGSQAENIVMWPVTPGRLRTIISGISEVVLVEARRFSRCRFDAFRQLGPVGGNIGNPAMAERAARSVRIFDDQCEASGSSGTPLHLSGGNWFSPERAYFLGIGLSCVNPVLIKVSAMAFLLLRWWKSDALRPMEFTVLK